MLYSSARAGRMPEDVRSSMTLPWLTVWKSSTRYNPNKRGRLRPPLFCGVLYGWWVMHPSVRLAADSSPQGEPFGVAEIGTLRRRKKNRSNPDSIGEGGVGVRRCFRRKRRKIGKMPHSLTEKPIETCFDRKRRDTGSGMVLPLAAKHPMIPLDRRGWGAFIAHFCVIHWIQKQSERRPICRNC